MFTLVELAWLLNTASPKLVRLGRLVLTLLPLLFVVACRVPAGSQSMFKVTAHKPDAQVEARSEGPDWVITVTSPSGIGSADVEALSDQRPRRVMLRFYLQGLEEMRFAFGEAVAQVALSSSGGEVRQATTDGGKVEQTVTDSSPYWMATRRVEPEGYFEVLAPSAFVQGDARRFTLSWVDFYR